MNQRGNAIIFIVLAILIIGIGALVATKFNIKFTNPSQVTQKITDQAQVIMNQQSGNINPLNNFFLFSTPKPLANLSIYQLPYDKYPTSVVRYKDSIWFNGDGNLIEYDPNKGEFIGYTDGTKAWCDRDLVLVNDYIYASCHLDNIDDAFGNVNQLTTPVFTGRYGIVKLNPATHKVERVFTRDDGLLDNYNYKLYPDGDNIWIATFQGVGKIDTTTDKVTFYQKELQAEGDKISVYPMLIDKNYVWAIISASDSSYGGFAVFDKGSQQWTVYGPHEIKDYQFDRLDLEPGAIKTIPGGIQVAFRDGEIGSYDRLVEKQYNYQTKKWTKISEQPNTGDYAKLSTDYLAKNYPATPSNVFTDSQGLTQLKISDQIYILNGRDNLLMSDLINGKRYVLTNATIDVIDETNPFRILLVKLGSHFPDVYAADPSTLSSGAEFLIDPETLTALVIDLDNYGMGESDQRKIIVVDLKNARVVKTYTGDIVPNSDLMSNLKISKKNDLLMVTNQKDNTPVFAINSKDYSLKSFVQNQ